MIGPLIARYDDVAEARRELLARRSLADAPLPGAVVQKIREVFGKPLSPSEVVAKIIADVRAAGATAIRRSPGAIAGRQVDSLVAGPAELAGAVASAPPEVTDGLEVAAGKIRSSHERARRNSW